MPGVRDFRCSHLILDWLVYNPPRRICESNTYGRYRLRRLPWLGTVQDLCSWFQFSNKFSYRLAVYSTHHPQVRAIAAYVYRRDRTPTWCQACIISNLKEPSRSSTFLGTLSNE